MIANILKWITPLRIGNVIIPWLAVMAVYAGWKTIDIARDDWNATTEWEERGQRGDFWGGHIAAGASVVANLLLIITLLLQREELRLQRQELKASRLEMIESREVAERQEVALRQQVDVARQSAELSQLLSLDNRLSAMRNESGIQNRAYQVGRRTEHHETWREKSAAKQYLNLRELMSHKVERLDMPDNEKQLLLAFLGLVEDLHYRAAMNSIQYISGE